MQWTSKNGEPYEILEVDPPIYEYEEKKQSEVTAASADETSLALQEPEDINPEWHKEPPTLLPYTILFSEPPIYVYKSEEKQQEKKSKQSQKKRKKAAAGTVPTRKVKRKGMQNKQQSRTSKKKKVVATDESDGVKEGGAAVINMNSKEEAAAEQFDEAMKDPANVLKVSQDVTLQPPPWYVPLYWCHPAVLNPFSYGQQQQQQMTDEQWAYYNAVSELSQPK